MPDVVSAYISGSGTRAVQCRVGEDELTAVRSASAPRPRLTRSFDPDRVNEELRTFLSDHDFDSLPLIVSIPSHLGFLRQLNLPFTEKEQIMETAPYELEQYIQTVSIEDTHVDISVQGITGSGSRIMAGALEKEVLEDIISAVSTGGLEGISIQFDNVACFNLLTMQGFFEKQKSGWILYMNGTNVSIILVESRLPAEAREFQILTGGPERTQGADMDSTDSSEADGEAQEEEEENEPERETNNQEGEGEGPPEEEISFQLSPKRYVSRLVREMEKTLLASGLPSFPKRLFLLGSPPGDVSADQVRAHLDQHFKLEGPFGEPLDIDPGLVSENVSTARSSEPDGTSPSKEKDGGATKESQDEEGDSEGFEDPSDEDLSTDSQEDKPDDEVRTESVLGIDGEEEVLVLSEEELEEMERSFEMDPDLEEEELDENFEIPEDEEDDTEEETGEQRDSSENGDQQPGSGNPETEPAEDLNEEDLSSSDESRTVSGPAETEEKEEMEEDVENNNPGTGTGTETGEDEDQEESSFRPTDETDERVEDALEEAVSESSPVEEYISDYEFHWECGGDRSKFPVPLGAAPANIAKVPCPIEFRKGEFAHKKVWETVKYSVAIFAFALLITAVSYLLINKEDRDRYQKEYQKYVSVQQKEFKNLYPNRTLEFKTRVPYHLEQRVKEEREKIGKGLPLKTSALQYWVKVFENIHVRGDIQFSSFSIRLEQRGGGEIQVAGETTDTNLAIRLKNQINSVEGIGTPRDSRVNSIDNNKSRFQFSFPILRKNNK